MLGAVAASRRRNAAPAYVAGQTIANLANTTVTPAATAGFTIAKSGGVAGTNDAAATSANLAGNSRVRVKHGAGDYRGGIAVNPGGSIGPASGANGGYMIWRTGANAYILDRFQNQSVALGAVATYPYAWLEYTAADDKVRAYRGTTADFASAELMHTSAAQGVGNSWGFDSMLSAAGSTFEAHFDAF